MYPEQGDSETANAGYDTTAMRACPLGLVPEVPEEPLLSQEKHKPRVSYASESGWVAQFMTMLTALYNQVSRKNRFFGSHHPAGSCHFDRSPQNPFKGNPKD
jgi:hypothetical protein